MPITKSAKKKVRQDKKRRARNLICINNYKTLLKQIKKTQDKEKLELLVKKCYSALDKAAKKKVIHKNKASRLKSSLAKYLSKIKKS